MRLPLHGLEVFVAIDRAGSLRGAAALLGLTASTVSQQLRSLERRLGTALFARTTRSLTLTAAGRELRSGAAPAFDQLADAMQRARDVGQSRRGQLRIALPEFAYALVVEPPLESFRARYPDLDLEFVVADGFTDIVREGVHAGIRLGDRIHRDMIAVPLTGSMQVGVVAAPALLDRVGVPASPADLIGLECLGYRFASSGRLAPWEFDGPDGPFRVDVGGGLVVNTLPALVSQARLGLGFAYCFVEYVRQDLNAGRLRLILTDWLRVFPGLHLYYPRAYRGMAILRAFAEHFRV